MPPTVNVPVDVVNSIISLGVWVGYATVTRVGLPFSSGIMSPSWSWPNVVHFHVLPALSVTYWLLPALTFPVAVLFARINCVPLLFLICFWRVRFSRGPRVCLASFPARVFFPAV